MFKILQKTLSIGIATVAYPDVPAVVSGQFRGRPEFHFAAWRDARPAAEACPTGAIVLHDDDSGHRRVTVDYGLCIFCGQCADTSPEGAVRVTTEFALATYHRAGLMLIADYTLNPDGRWREPIITRWSRRKRRATSSAKSSTRRWGARSPSARWTPVRATGAKWKSWRSTIPSTISNASAFTSWPRLGMPTCCWSPDPSRATWNWRYRRLIGRRRTPR